MPAAFGVALALLYFAGERFTLGEIGYPLDDSYIHLRFAQSLAAGHGLSYNLGQLSTGSSSPLWTALLSLGFLLPGFGLLWPKLLGILCLVATVLGAQRLLAQLGADPLFQRGGGLLVATSHWLVWSAVSGMEVLLFASLILWTMILALREERADPERPGLAAPLLAGLTALSRPEGLLLVVLVLACRAWRLQPAEDSPAAPRLLPRSWAGAVRAAALAAIVALPLIAFQYYVGGSPWPSSMVAKTIPDDSILPNLRYLVIALNVLWDGCGILVLFAGAGALVLGQRAVQGFTNALLPFLLLFGLPAVYSLTASTASPPPVGNYGRYLFPLFPVVVVLALLGLEQGLKAYRGGVRLGPIRLPLPAIGIAILVVLQAGTSVYELHRYALNVKNVAESDVAAARFLLPRLPPEAVIATQDIGAVGLMMPNPLVDMAGIVTPELIPLLRPSTREVYWEELLYQYFEQHQVDVVLAFAENYPGLVGGKVGQLQPVTRFKIDHNITMGGNELVILRTPWCRFCQALPSPQP